MGKPSAISAAEYSYVKPAPYPTHFHLYGQHKAEKALVIRTKGALKFLTLVRRPSKGKCVLSYEHLYSGKDVEFASPLSVYGGAPKSNPVNLELIVPDPLHTSWHQAGAPRSSASREFA